MEGQTKKWQRLVEYTIDELTKLKIKAEFEDRQRGKKRYVSKVSAYQDLIDLLEKMLNEED